MSATFTLCRMRMDLSASNLASDASSQYAKTIMPSSASLTIENVYLSKLSEVALLIAAMLNSSNVTGNYNSSFTYKFINGSYDLPAGTELCCSSIVIPYSWFNLNSSYYANTTFQFNWPTSAGVFTPYVFSIPNGFYTVPQLVQEIQFLMIAQNLYLYTGTGSTAQNIFFFNIIPNSTYYTNTLFLYGVPTTATLATMYPGATAPVGFPYPTVSQTPQFIVMSQYPAFGSLIGFLPGTYAPSPNPPAIVAPATYASYNVNGNTTPNLTPVNSVIVACNIVSNNVTIPSNIVTSIPINNTFGSLITFNASFEQWVPVLSPSKYSSITVNLLDQNLNPIVANDPNILITIMIRTPKKSQLMIK